MLPLLIFHKVDSSWCGICLTKAHHLKHSSTKCMEAGHGFHSFTTSLFVYSTLSSSRVVQLVCPQCIAVFTRLASRHLSHTHTCPDRPYDLCVSLIGQDGRHLKKNEKFRELIGHTVLCTTVNAIMLKIGRCCMTQSAAHYRCLKSKEVGVAHSQ